jgi:hypothetical protein
MRNSLDAEVAQAKQGGLIEAIEAATGARLRALAVDVKDRNILIRAKAKHGEVRAALERLIASLSSLEGYHAQVLVDAEPQQ